MGGEVTVESKGLGHGATFIRGTDTHAGKWYAIHVVTAAVFHASTAYENSD